MQKHRVLIILLAVAFLCTGCGSVESAGGGKASDFSLTSINDTVVRLSQYENKVVILNFFATWCPPCRREIPDFVELMNEYGDRLVILGVSLDKGDVESLRNFATSYGINYPILIDDGQVSKAYGPIRSIPTTFIIDRNGKIVEKIIGSRRKSYFEKVIKPLLQ